MKVDYLIRNGRVIDPSQGIDEIRDVAVKSFQIVESKDGNYECGQVIDAQGCLVLPGLIDAHTHIFHEGSNICIHPDLMIAQGTTAAIDAGSAGTATFEAFYKTVLACSVIKTRAFLTLYAGGQLDPKLTEDFDYHLYNLDKTYRIVEKYGDVLLGFKIRLSKNVVPDDKAAEYLINIIRIAEEIESDTGVKLRINIHTTNSPIPAGEIADILREGDVFTHCFQGAGNTIVDDNGNIDQRVLNARRRGVLFDSANGKGNFGIACAKASLKAGFYPDIISSDLTSDKFNMPPYAKNLPTVLSKYVSLGMPLNKIVEAVTRTPARLMGLDSQIGTLKGGALANITILKEKPVKITHKDFRDEEFDGDILLIPQLTMIDGEIQYCQTDFWY